MTKRISLALVILSLMFAGGSQDVPRVSPSSSDDCRPPGASAMVVITFDDGYDTDYATAFPILDSRGIPGTSYVCAGRIGQPGKLEWAQIGELLDAGWTIGCHTNSHPDLTTLTEQQIREEMVEVNSAFLAASLPAPQHHAYPLGRFDELVKSVVGEYRLTGRGLESGGETITSAGADDWMELRSYGIYNHGVVRIKALIDRAIERNQCLILYTHRITESPGFYDTTPDDLEAIADYIVLHRDEITPVTIGTVYSLYEGVPCGK